MTDYELLGCVAEAMHNLKDPNFCNYSVVDGKTGVCLDLGFRRGAITSYWNPLTNDGDALRMVCDLGLRVFPIARTQSGAACSAVCSVTSERLSEVADASLDTYTATRRAIVLAAAEIGKRIKGGQHGVSH
jgi:hypothetical protein